MIDIKDLIKGEKYTIVTDDIFGGQFNTRVTFVSLKNHGFDTKDGAWTLYGSNNETAATFLICKRFKKGSALYLM